MSIASEKKLELWKGRLVRCEAAYSSESARMDHREELYEGTNELFNAHTGETHYKKATHVYNVIAELIEAQVDTNIPPPKVTPMHREDEGLAIMIENMLRNELDRQPFEMMNDQSERTVPIQGGVFWLVEWDNRIKPNGNNGGLVVRTIHPKQFIPQDGVNSGIEDMDYFFLKLPQTKQYIRDKYGVDVSDETESDPEVRDTDGTADLTGDMVTQVVAYYRNNNGGIGIISWVNDTVLEDMEDYQARRLRRCKNCGAIEGTNPAPSIIGEDGEIAGTTDGTFPLDETKPAPEPKKAGRNVCPFCGGTKWEDSTEEYQEVIEPVFANGQMVASGATEQIEDGEAVIKAQMVPFFKPDQFPVVLMRNVSVYGKLLGESDADKLEYQQNTINRLATSINDKLLKRGSYMTLPRQSSIKVTDEEGYVIRINDMTELSMINVRNMEFDVQSDMNRLATAYEEAKNIIGVTDSYLGRKDTTATSGTAKQFSAAQAAGRMESKRVTKHSAYATLYELMFKFMLAYADDPRPVRGESLDGSAQYSEFDRWAFLRQNENGDFEWNTDFMFSCDTAASLATNREAMWQETRLNLQTGAFGDPQDIQSLIFFWRKMEMLHYPGASETKMLMEQRYQQQVAMQQQQMQMQAAMQQQQMQIQQQRNAADYQIKAEKNAINREKLASDRQNNKEKTAMGIMNAARSDATAQINAQNAAADKRKRGESE